MIWSRAPSTCLSHMPPPSSTSISSQKSITPRLKAIDTVNNLKLLPTKLYQRNQDSGLGYATRYKQTEPLNPTSNLLATPNMYAENFNTREQSETSHHLTRCAHPGAVANVALEGLPPRLERNNAVSSRRRSRRTAHC